jgi:hypothetical protein
MGSFLIGGDDGLPLGGDGGERVVLEVEDQRERTLIRTSVGDKYLGLMKIIPQIDHISHCKAASGTN